MKKVANWLRHHIWRIGIAWVVGCIVYVVGSILTSNYAGFESLLCQPVVAVCASSLFVLSAIVVGLPLAIPSIKRLWSKALILNLAFLIVGFVLLFFSQAFGLNTELTDPETNQTFVGPHPVAVILGFFLLTFSIVNWPFKPSPTAQDRETVEQEQVDSE
jgi:hypothetical protein